MIQRISLKEAEKIVKENGLNSITLLKYRDVLIPIQELLLKIQKETAEVTNSLSKYIIFMGGGCGKS